MTMEWHEELHQKLDQILRRIDGIMATMQPEPDGAAVELGADQNAASVPGA